MMPAGWELFAGDAYYVWGSVVATLVSMAVEWAAVAARERDVERRRRKSGIAPA